MSNPHPDDDRVDPAIRRLLSAPPPLESLEWVERALRGRVVASTPLPGGMSSAVHRLTVETRRARQMFVLRRYVRDDLMAEEPDIAEREVRTLRLIESVDLVTPVVIAHDDDGTEAGVPTILMTVVPGRANDVQHHPATWRQLAEAAATIHQAPVALADGVQEFHGYAPRRATAPPWMTDQRLWDHALAVFREHRAPGEGVLLHRDFHTGNVLWHEGQLSGVVDWQSASVGPASADIGYMRFDLLDRYGPTAADAFLAIAAEVTGARQDPWADVILLVDSLGGATDRPPRHHEVLEAILAHALAELGAR